MTWDDLKIFTLQKIFAITGDTLVDNATTFAVFEVNARRGEWSITASFRLPGKYIIKSYDITQGRNWHRDRCRNTIYPTLQRTFYTFRDVYLNDGEKYAKTNRFQRWGLVYICYSFWICRNLDNIYNAYPQSITKLTTGETELALDPEVAAIIPLYMASQLYKEDDFAMATMWRNEFEAARELLFANAPAPSIEITHTYEGW